MIIEKNTGKMTGSRVTDEKGDVVMEGEHERIDVIAGVYVPVEIKSTSKTDIGGKEIKMTTRMIYKNVKINENIKEKEFEIK